MKKKVYLAPEIEVLDIAIERGFAYSTLMDINIDGSGSGSFRGFGPETDWDN